MFENRRRTRYLQWKSNHGVIRKPSMCYRWHFLWTLLERCVCNIPNVFHCFISCDTLQNRVKTITFWPRQGLFLMLTNGFFGILTRPTAVYHAFQPECLSVGSKMPYWNIGVWLNIQLLLHYSINGHLSIGIIQVRNNDPRSLRSWCIKGAEESTLRHGLLGL